MKAYLLPVLYPLGFIFFVAAQVSGQDIGGSREAVLEALGQPTGIAKMGNREILSYGERRVILVDGVVARIEGNSAEASPAQTTANRASPTPARTTATERPATPPMTGWLTDYELAKKQAALHNRPILILFTGSDWCPPCIAFERGIAADPRFRNFASANLILLKADFPRTYTLPPTIKAQNEALAREFGVRGFPTILAVNSSGKHLGTLDRSEANRGNDPVALHIAGIESMIGGAGAGLASSKYVLWAVLLGLGWFIYRRVT
ncbi:MAG: thioredoxin family protein [Puniceicoccaceae bacterium]|nr:MAG: thioredoxin family protein [Puniceicoccaceae bacterium]